MEDSPVKSLPQKPQDCFDSPVSIFVDLGKLSNLRIGLARNYMRRRLRERDVTILSDDCWGGKLYKELGLPCRSPLVSLGVHVAEYLDLLFHIKERGALEVTGCATHPQGYPLLRTPYAWLYGFHYRSHEEFLQSYERRRKRMVWDKLFIKIDLGKDECRPEHIARWNELRLPNSIALYPDEPEFRAFKIHHGVAMPDWQKDGSRQFAFSCRRFDVFHWLNTGTIERSPSYRCFQFLLFDRRPFQRVQQKVSRLFTAVSPRSSLPGEAQIPADLAMPLHFAHREKSRTSLSRG